MFNVEPGSYVVLQVTDTGTGIPPKILERIFDLFFTTKGPIRGTGLGLATTVGLVTGHAGFIRAYSVVDEGTTFKVYLPSHAAAESGVIVASGLVGERERDHFARLGVKAFRSKPFTQADLVAALRTVFVKLPGHSDSSVDA